MFYKMFYKSFYKMFYKCFYKKFYKNFFMIFSLRAYTCARARALYARELGVHTRGARARARARARAHVTTLAAEGPIYHSASPFTSRASVV